MSRQTNKKILSGLNIQLSSDTIQKLSEARSTPYDKEDDLKLVKEHSKTNDASPQDCDIEEDPNVSVACKNQSQNADSATSGNSSTVKKVEPKIEQNIVEVKPNKSDVNCNLSNANGQLPSASSAVNDYSEHIHYENDQAIYTDPQDGTKYVWCISSNAWIIKSDSENTSEARQTKYGFENDKHTYTDSDGAKYVWDSKENAWFPNVDDDFLAHYQMSYGFVDNTKKSEIDDLDEKERKELPPTESSNTMKRKGPQPAEWFNVSDDFNTKVYVSNLPTDITEDEFIELMQKCGLVMKDPKTQKMKVKLYTDKESNLFKGDALCCYIKIESVDLALNIVDGTDLRGHKIKVERAQFQMKGEYDPSLKPKKKKKDKEKLKKIQEKLFDWRPEKLRGEPAKNERVVIVKNLFEPSLFDEQVHLLLEYQQDLRDECSKIGEVRKVVLYDRHPEGVAQVNMKEVEDATKVVTLLNGRWFGKRKLTAEIWDGRTKYRIAETESEISKRIGGWEKFLDADESKIKIVESEK